MKITIKLATFLELPIYFMYLYERGSRFSILPGGK